MPDIQFIHITRKQPKTRTYTSASCHEVGYGWHITAPSEVNPSEIEKLQDALVSWHDEPDQKHIDEVLKCHDDYENAPDDLIQLLMQVRFEVKAVHRDCFTQSFEETTVQKTEARQFSLTL